MQKETMIYIEEKNFDCQLELFSHPHIVPDRNEKSRQSKDEQGRRCQKLRFNNRAARLWLVGE
jgi:hypothetical protein